MKEDNSSGDSLRDADLVYNAELVIVSSQKLPEVFAHSLHY